MLLNPHLALGVALSALLALNLIFNAAARESQDEEAQALAFFTLAALFLTALSAALPFAEETPPALTARALALSEILFAAAALHYAMQIFPATPFSKVGALYAAAKSHKHMLWTPAAIAALLLFFAPAVASWGARLALALLTMAAAAALASPRHRDAEELAAILPVFAPFALAASLALASHFAAPQSETLLANSAAALLALGITIANLRVFRQRLEAEGRSAALAAAAARHGIWDWRRKEGALFLSPIVEKTFLGMRLGELKGSEAAFRALIHEEDRQNYARTLQSLAERKKGAACLLLRIRHAAGHYRWFELHVGVPSGRVSPRRGSGGRLIGFLKDVTERKWREDHALHDPTTGLPGRALLLDRAERMMEKAKKGDAGHSALILFHSDLSQNGEGLARDPSIAESALLALARRLSQSSPPGSMAARIGVESFALLLPPGAPSPPEEEARRLRDRLREPLRAGRSRIALPIAAGVAAPRSLKGRGGAKELLERAEKALWRAKRGKRERVRIFDPSMESRAARRKTLEKDLRQALSKNQIRLLYQPIMRLEDTKSVGFEALMRWDHPHYGAVPPSEFIPLAEKSGVIDALGLHALKRAARAIGAWQLTHRYDEPLFVSVNLSRRELFRETLAQETKRAIAEAFLAPGSLRLEVTESLVMRDPDKASRVLQQLRAAGASLSIDDFGTGHSSLACLKTLPFDAIKIDRLLIQGLESDPQARAIFHAIAKMARALSMDVIAEGVDEAKRVPALREAGCLYAQGFYFAAPMEEEEARAFLSRNRPR